MNVAVDSAFHTAIMEPFNLLSEHLFYSTHILGIRRLLAVNDMTLRPAIDAVTRIFQIEKLFLFGNVVGGRDFTQPFRRASCPKLWNDDFVGTKRTFQ
jgi:hypothetical protein